MKIVVRLHLFWCRSIWIVFKLRSNSMGIREKIERMKCSKGIIDPCRQISIRKFRQKLSKKFFSSNDFLDFLRRSKEKIRYDEKPFYFLRFSFPFLLSICFFIGIFLLKLLHRKCSLWKTKRKYFFSIYFLLNFIFIFQLIFLFENLFQTENFIRKSFDHFNEEFYPKKFAESFEKVQNEIEKNPFRNRFGKRNFSSNFRLISSNLFIWQT